MKRTSMVEAIKKKQTNLELIKLGSQLTKSKGKWNGFYY